MDSSRRRPERPETREILKATGVTVFLDSDWNTILGRISVDKSRPLAVNDNNWETTFNLFNKRLPLYEQADLRITSHGKTISQIAEEVFTEIKKHHGFI